MEQRHPIIDLDSHFIINPDSRKITTTATNLKLIQKDFDSERITFEIPEFVEGHPMIESDKIEVHFVNIDRKTKEESCDVYFVDDAYLEDNKVIFSWLISPHATKYYGVLEFMIAFNCYDSKGNYTYRWNTEICKLLKIGPGLDNKPAIIEDYPDAFEQLRKDIKKNSLSIDEIIDGTTIVDKAKKDQEGNIIDETYATKAELNTEVTQHGWNDITKPWDGSINIALPLTDDEINIIKNKNYVCLVLGTTKFYSDAFAGNRYYSFISQIRKSGKVVFAIADIVDKTITITANNFISNTDLSTALATKANVSDVYTKDQTYNKTEVNEKIDATLSSVYKPAGTVDFAELPTPTKNNLGYVYNVNDAFITNDKFVEGAGKNYPAGTNVVVIEVGEDFKYDVLSGMVDLTYYYTKEQVDSAIKTNIENVTDGLTDGTIVPKKATSATNDGKGNVIDETYATKAEMVEQAPVVALSTDDTITNTTLTLTDEQIESLKNEQAIIKVSCSADNCIYFFRLEQGYIEFTDKKVYNTFSFLGSETDGIAYQLTLEPTQKKAKIYKKFEFGDRTSIENIIDGITVVAKANADAKGNIIDTTYATNTRLEQKLTLIRLAPTSSAAIEEGSIELTPAQKTAFGNADKDRLVISVGPLGDGLADYSYFYVSGVHPSGSVISYYFNSPNGYTGHIDYMWIDSTITFNYTKTPEYATKSSVDTLTTKVTQNTTDIGNKVDKVDYSPLIDIAYGVDTTGTTKMFGIAQNLIIGTLAQRDVNGEIAVATPTQNESATNKKYVDDLVGNINTILATMFNDVEVTE